MNIQKIPTGNRFRGIRLWETFREGDLFDLLGDPEQQSYGQWELNVREMRLYWLGNNKPAYITESENLLEAYYDLDDRDEEPFLDLGETAFFEAEMQDPDDNDPFFYATESEYFSTDSNEENEKGMEQ